MTEPSRVELQWDLSRSHAVAQVDWPGGLASAYHFLRGDLSLTLKLPAERTLRAELADIQLQRKDGELYVLELRGHPLTLEQAVSAAEERMAELHLPRKDFDGWSLDARSGDFRKKRAFATRRNDLDPALSLEVRPSQHPDRPWYLSLKIVWRSSRFRMA